MISKPKTVTIHKCEHCGKTKTNNRPWMERHEQGCTANPNRRCGFCNRQWPEDRMNPPLEPFTFEQWEAMNDLLAAKTISALEEAYSISGEEPPCPGCIIAELRQTQRTGWAEFSCWDFNKAREIWRNHERELQAENDAHIGRGV